LRPEPAQLPLQGSAQLQRPTPPLLLGGGEALISERLVLNPSQPSTLEERSQDSPALVWRCRPAPQQPRRNRRRAGEKLWTLRRLGHLFDPHPGFETIIKASNVGPWHGRLIVGACPYDHHQ